MLSNKSILNHHLNLNKVFITHAQLAFSPYITLFSWDLFLSLIYLTNYRQLSAALAFKLSIFHGTCRTQLSHFPGSSQSFPPTSPLPMPTSLAFISSWLNAWLPDISLIKSALYTNETHPCVYCHLPNGASSGILRVALRCVASLFISSFVSSFTTRSLSVCMETLCFTNWIQVESTNMNKQSESRVYWTTVCAAPLINK